MGTWGRPFIRRSLRVDGIWLHVSSQWWGEGLSRSIVPQAPPPGDHLFLHAGNLAWLLWYVSYHLSLALRMSSDPLRRITSDSVQLRCLCRIHTPRSQSFSHSMGRTWYSYSSDRLCQLDAHVDSEDWCSDHERYLIHQNSHPALHCHHRLGCTQWQGPQNQGSARELSKLFCRLISLRL